EVLVFKRNVDINNINEKFSTTPLSVNTQNSISMLNTFSADDCVKYEPCVHKKNPVVINKSYFNEKNNGFEYLDSSHLQMVKQRQKLHAHASFTPVLHTVWRMPVESRAKAKPIHLFAGTNYASTTNNQQNDDTSTLAAAIDKWAIDGNFKIFLDHYLFIDSQLIVRQQTTTDVPVEQSNNDAAVISSENGVELMDVNNESAYIETKKETIIAEILFDQNRRLRSEEIHYLDHPMMGILVQIRKIK
ncbi:MAG: CsiV family protein, partial [Psychromonas sp.]